VNILKQLIPGSIKTKVSHARFWRERYNRRNASVVASHGKRLDLCAAQFAHWLHISGNPPLQDKVCLELGTGWIATHALIAHLLGAKKVVTTDIEALIRPSFIGTAVREAVPSIVRDVLSPFERHDRIRRRLDRLRSIRTYTLEVLGELGVEYIAPIDLAKSRLNIPLDFVYSNSVLEHVPVDDVSSLLDNLTADLAPGGTMIHAIHLEDHRDIEHAPFLFLAESGREYDSLKQTEYGNRIRKSHWCKFFDHVEGLESRLIFEFTRPDKALPPTVDSAISYVSEDDLRVSHVGVYGVKK